MTLEEKRNYQKEWYRKKIKSMSKEELKKYKAKRKAYQRKYFKKMGPDERKRRSIQTIAYRNKRKGSEEHKKTILLQRIVIRKIKQRLDALLKSNTDLISGV